MEFEKYYTLYTDKNQKKFLSLAASLEKVNEETEYYTEGVWFEYDKKPGSNLLLNEKELKGICFPKECKKRNYEEYDSNGKISFKWVS